MVVMGNVYNLVYRRIEQKGHLLLMDGVVNWEGG